MQPVKVHRGQRKKMGLNPQTEKGRGVIPQRDCERQGQIAPRVDPVLGESSAPMHQTLPLATRENSDSRLASGSALLLAAGLGLLLASPPRVVPLPLRVALFVWAALALLVAGSRAGNIAWRRGFETAGLAALYAGFILMLARREWPWLLAPNVAWACIGVWFALAASRAVAARSPAIATLAVLGVAYAAVRIPGYGHAVGGAVFAVGFALHCWHRRGWSGPLLAALVVFYIGVAAHRFWHNFGSPPDELEFLRETTLDLCIWGLCTAASLAPSARFRPTVRDSFLIINHAAGAGVLLHAVVESAPERVVPFMVLFALALFALAAVRSRLDRRSAAQVESAAGVALLTLALAAVAPTGILPGLFAAEAALLFLAARRLALPALRLAAVGALALAAVALAG